MAGFEVQGTAINLKTQSKKTEKQGNQNQHGFRKHTHTQNAGNAKTELQENGNNMSGRPLSSSLFRC